MYFDFHTHVFPDEIADRAIANLKHMAAEGVGREDAMKPHTDGTLEGLKRSMERGGIDRCLVLPVCTRPEQFETVNKYAASINGIDGIYSFGGIHPDCDKIEDKLEYIKSLGLKGIKLHPAYQHTNIKSKKYLAIAEHCMKIGLYMVFHAGYDIAFPNDDYCEAKTFAKSFSKLLEKYGEDEHPHVILAHLGGIMTLDKTLDYLCGMPIYMDMANTLEQVPTDKLMRVIRSHGANRILFASDSPWQSQRKCRERLASLPISKAEFEAISYGNAMEIVS